MSTSVTGNINDLTGTAVTSNCYVRFWLRGCNGNQPRVGGSALIAPDNGPTYFQDFVPNGSGQISGTLYSNDVNVSAGGQVGVTWYGVQVFLNGIPGAETPYTLADGVSFNLNSATPISTNPVVAAPTGDSTYVRLDDGNIASAANPFLWTNPIKFKTQNRIRYAEEFGLTDVGIQAAINDCPDGGIVELGGDNTYVITGTITISKRITIRGGGWGTVLQVGSGVGATTDVFLLKPSTAADVQGMRFQDFYITPASGTPARYGFNIDGTNASIAYCVFDHIRVDTLGNYALAVTNSSGNPNGSPYTTAINNCLFSGGINLDIAGDTINIEGSTFTGVRDIVVNQVGAAGSNGGAHGFRFIGNNVTVNGGSIIKNAWQGLWAYNDMEQPNASTEANSALLDIQGNASANVQNFKIYGNYLGANSGNVTDTIRIDRATATEIFNNFTARSTGVAYRITANAVKTHIVHDRLAPDTTINNFLADLGTNTLVEYVDSATGIKTVAFGNTFGLQFSTLAGVVGSIANNVGFLANASNGVLGFTSGIPGQTGVDTAAWRAGANSWAFGNAFGDTSGNQIYRFTQLIENTAPSGVSGRGIIYADSTTHRVTMNNNNGGASQVVGVDAKTSQKAESAADTNVLTFTPPALAGSYRIRFILSISAAASAVVGWTATWKDSNGTAKSPTNLSLYQVGTAVPALTFTTSTTDDFYGSAEIDIDNSATAIVIKFTLGSGTITAKASATVERLI